MPIARKFPIFYVEITTSKSISIKSYTDDLAYDLLRHLELKVLASKLKKETFKNTQKDGTDGNTTYHHCFEKINHFKDELGNLFYLAVQHIDHVEDYYKVYIVEFESEQL